MEIAGASLDKGLLHIELVRPRAEDVSRTIKIRRGRPQSA
jgi:HSP20 family molecular chaperone IbpA